MFIGDDPLDHLRSRSAQALLIYLAVEARPQQREFLVELLWPGMPLNYGRKNLRQTLYELRRALPTAGNRIDDKPAPELVEGPEPVEGLILADRQTIALNPKSVVVLDTAAFEKRIRSGIPTNLEQAVDLYRGDFLADFYLPDSSNFEEWASSKRAAYRRQMLDALEELADLTLSAGDSEKAERFARQQLALDDLREPAVRQLMIALTHQGQRHNALQAYGELRERLRNTLDVEPAQETADIYKQIQEESLSRVTEKGAERAGETERAQKDWLGADEGTVSAHNLPAAVTPFIGRSPELAEIEDLLLSSDHRLLTLLGPGGIGKSRLALEVAGRLINNYQFPDGIWFVPLAAFEEVQQITPAIAAPLPFDFFGSLDPQRQLLDYLSDKRLLLLLDNMEQLSVSGPLTLLREILARAPGVKLLAASRAPLRVQGEQLYPLGGLALPSQLRPSMGQDASEWARQYDAVQLFETSARRVCPDFNLEKENIEEVLAIGRTVEGFPLALEMAAAWVELLSPAEIEQELAQSFDLLEAEWTSATGRHQSARAVFEWSWRLLSAKEQDFCQALSLFRGGFSREAALAVGQATLPTLLNLKRKSWLQQTESDRYHIHELLRQYTEEKLRENEKRLQQAVAEYVRYFVSYFEQLAEASHGPQQQGAFAAIEKEFDNARVAWHWLVDQRQYVAITSGLLPALFFHTTTTGRFPEARGLIGLARDRLAHESMREDFQLAILALNAAECKLEYDYLGGDVFGEVTVPSDLLHESWDIMIWEPAGFSEGPWATFIATFYGWQQDRGQGLHWLRRLANDYQEKGDRWLYAFSLQALGQLLIMRATQRIPAAATSDLTAEKEEALDEFKQALNIFVELGDALEQSRTLRWIGHLVQGEDPRMALGYFLRANSLLEDANLPAIHYYAYLASCHLSLGEYDEAFRIFAQARRYYERQGNQVLFSGAMSLASMFASRYGDIDQARDWREASIKIYQELGYDQLVIYGSYELGEIDRVAGLIESARRHYEQAFSSFVTLDDSHGLAFCRRGLGDLALSNSDYALARHHFETAIQLAKDPFVHSWLTCQIQIRLAQTAIHLGDIKEAEEHLQQAARLFTFRAIIDSKDLLTLAFAEIAALMVAKKEVDRALTLATFVAHHPASWHETRRRAQEVVATAAAKLSPAEISAAKAQGQQMTLKGAQALVNWV